MPYTVSGNINAAVLMIAEHGSQIIKDSYAEQSNGTSWEISCEIWIKDLENICLSYIFCKNQITHSEILLEICRIAFVLLKFFVFEIMNICWIIIFFFSIKFFNKLHK